jgi:hypothetical protein
MLKPLALGVLIGIALSLLFGRRNQLARGRSARVERTPPTDEPPPSGAPDDNLERLTKSELYRRAKDAGIAGRSEMSKAQLIAALRAGRSGPH